MSFSGKAMLQRSTHPAGSLRTLSPIDGLAYNVQQNTVWGSAIPGQTEALPSVIHSLPDLQAGQNKTEQVANLHPDNSGGNSNVHPS